MKVLGEIFSLEDKLDIYMIIIIIPLTKIMTSIYAIQAEGPFKERIIPIAKLVSIKARPIVNGWFVITNINSIKRSRVIVLRQAMLVYKTKVLIKLQGLKKLIEHCVEVAKEYTYFK